MSGRPDDGYQVAARIESRSGRRGRLLAILFGVVVVAWGATVLGRGPADRAARATDSGRIGDASGPLGSATPTFPPDVEILDQRMPTAKLPVEFGGLEFLDPRAGTLVAAAPANWLRFPFATADGGAVCVCVDPGTDVGAASVLHVTSFLDNGVAVEDLIVSDWLALGAADGIAIQARQVPGRKTFVVASAIGLAGRWSVRLDWLNTFDGDRAHEIVATIDDSALTAESVALELDIAPDGHQLRLRLGADASGEPVPVPEGSAGPSGAPLPSPSPAPSPARLWTVPILERGFGPPVVRVEAGPALPPASCFAQAWASPSAFVWLCQVDTGDGSGSLMTTLRIDAAGRVTEVPIGAGSPDEQMAWLVDGARGAVYGWGIVSHRLVRIDVSVGTLTDRYPGDGRTNLLGIPPEATPPPPRNQPAIWQPFWQPPSALVGAPDGSILYAVGLQPRTGSGVSGYESTGIWAFNADSLALVGHWRAAADYIGLALTADGETLMAFGEPSGEEQATFGNHGLLIVFQQAHDGTVLGVLRGPGIGPRGIPTPLAPPLPGGFGT